MKNYKLITGETIYYNMGASLTEHIEALNKDVEWKLLIVDKDNFIKGLKSINFNEVRESKVSTDGDYITLLLDYSCIKQGQGGNIYFILMFDDQEECISYILEDSETEKFKTLSESAGYYYIINLIIA